MSDNGEMPAKAGGKVYVVYDPNTNYSDKVVLRDPSRATEFVSKGMVVFDAETGESLNKRMPENVRPGPFESFVSGAGQGATFDLADDLAGLTDPAKRDEIRQKQILHSQENPKAHMMGRMAGAGVSAMLGGGLAAKGLQAAVPTMSSGTANFLGAASMGIPQGFGAADSDAKTESGQTKEQLASIAGNVAANALTFGVGKVQSVLPKTKLVSTIMKWLSPTDEIGQTAKPVGPPDFTSPEVGQLTNPIKDQIAKSESPMKSTLKDIATWGKDPVLGQKPALASVAGKELVKTALSNPNTDYFKQDTAKIFEDSKGVIPAQQTEGKLVLDESKRKELRELGVKEEDIDAIVNLIIQNNNQASMRPTGPKQETWNTNIPKASDKQRK